MRFIEPELSTMTKRTGKASSDVASECVRPDGQPRSRSRLVRVARRSRHGRGGCAPGDTGGVAVPTTGAAVPTMGAAEASSTQRPTTTTDCIGSERGTRVRGLLPALAIPRWFSAEATYMQETHGWRTCRRIATCKVFHVLAVI